MGMWIYFLMKNINYAFKNCFAFYQVKEPAGMVPIFAASQLDNKRQAEHTETSEFKIN